MKYIMTKNNRKDSSDIASFVEDEDGHQRHHRKSVWHWKGKPSKYGASILIAFLLALLHPSMAHIPMSSKRSSTDDTTALPVSSMTPSTALLVSSTYPTLSTKKNESLTTQIQINEHENTAFTHTSKSVIKPISLSGQLYEYAINAEMNVSGPNQKLCDDDIELWEELTTNVLLQRILANDSSRGILIETVLLLDVSLDRQFDFMPDHLLRDDNVDTKSRKRIRGSKTSSSKDIDHDETQKLTTKAGANQYNTSDDTLISEYEPKGLLLFQFSINIIFKTPEKDAQTSKQEITSYIKDTFNREYEEKMYIFALKQRASSSPSNEYNQQLSDFDSLSVEVTNVHQIYPQSEMLSSSASKSDGAIMAGLSVGASIFIISSLIIYLKKKSNSFVEGHVPLVAGSKSHQSRRYSWPTIPASIAVNKQPCTDIVGDTNDNQSRNFLNNEDTNSNQISISDFSPSKMSCQDDEQLVYLKQPALGGFRKDNTPRQPVIHSFQDSLSYHEPLHHNTKVKEPPQIDLRHRSKQGVGLVPAPPRSSRFLTTIDNDSLSRSSKAEDTKDVIFYSRSSFPRDSTSSTTPKPEQKKIPTPRTTNVRTLPPLGQVTRRDRLRTSAKSNESLVYLEADEMNTRDLTDDDPEIQELENSEIVELSVPPGALGLVIDTTQGGIPTVYSVEEDSVVVDRVREGDLLISVNEIDTTEFSAENVSSILSKAKNEHRKLVLFRQKSD